MSPSTSSEICPLLRSYNHAYTCLPRTFALLATVCENVTNNSGQIIILRTLEKSILTLEALASYLDDGKDEYEVVPARVKRSGGNGNRGVTYVTMAALLQGSFQWSHLSFRNLDIRDAIFKLLEVISNSSRRLEKEGTKNLEMSERILRKLDVRGGAGGGGSSASTDKKLDNISTFLLRYRDCCVSQLKRALPIVAG